MSLSNIPKCYATPSAGMHPTHTLPIKLRAIAAAGFPFAEIAFPELEAYAKEELKKEGYEYNSLNDRGEGDVEKLVDVAAKIRVLCEQLKVKVLALHPFAQFEGHRDSQKREAAFERAKSRFKVLKALDCQTLQVGSSNDSSITDSFDTMADDLRQLADEAAKQDPPIRIAYEMWSWGTYVNTWRHTWAICKRVGRDNFGLCLDTFQIAAREYADPTSSSGLASDSSSFPLSLQALASTIPPSKIFYLQISDGARVDPSQLKKDSEERQMQPLYLWSNKYRPLPFAKKEWKGYLPVVDVVEAVLKTGWRGPWSYEVFFEEDQAKDDPEVPRRWTQEAAKCHEVILRELARRDL